MPIGNKYTNPEKALSKMTFEELAQLRSTWLQEALDNGVIGACIKVGRELGMWYELEGINPFWRWTSGEIIVDYFEIKGDFMVAVKEYAIDRVVSVSIGLVKWKRGIQMGDHNNRVLYYAQGDDLTGLSKQNVFVPGNWLAPILHALPDAERSFQKTMKDKNEIESQKLVSLLSAGKEG